VALLFCPEGILTPAVCVVDKRPAVGYHPRTVQPHVAISIADTGTGIAADELEHIFEPFCATKGHWHGTGLGLSRVFGFAQQSTGDIAVQSKAGDGPIHLNERRVTGISPTAMNGGK